MQRLVRLSQSAAHPETGTQRPDRERVFARVGNNGVTHMRSKGIVGLVVGAVLATALMGGPAYGASEPTGELFGSTIAGEVDGVAGDEIVTVHAIESDTPSLDGLVELVLRRGKDGEPLWSKTVPAGSHTVVPARVGPDGVKGMYLIVRRYNYFVEIHSTQDGVSIMNPLPLLYGSSVSGFDVYALTATGETIWEQHVSGARDEDNPGRSVDAPLALGVLRATPSAATDIVLVLADTPAVIVEQNRDESSVRTRVLEGVDGSTASTATVANAPYGIADLAIADFDSDGLQDYATALAPKGVYAFRGSDSAALWASTGEFSTANPVADVSGDGVREVLAIRYDFNPSDVYFGDVRLIDGRTGGTRLDVEADDAWPAAGGIATVTKLVTNTESGIELDFYDGAGIHRRHRELLTPHASGTAAQVAVDRTLGDLNGDGTSDLSYTLTTGSGESATSRTVVTNGDTFAPMWSDRTVGQGLGDGRGSGGDDLLLVAPFGQYAREITLQDGGSGNELWTQRIVPNTEVTNSTSGTAGDLDGDGDMDVLVETDGYRRTPTGSVPEDIGSQRDYTTQLFALDGGNGALRWSR